MSIFKEKVCVVTGAGAGIGKALELMLEGKQLTPEEALDVGLVNRIVAKENLMDEALRLAKKMTRRPPVSVRGIKEAVRIGGSKGFMQGLEIEKKGLYATGYLKDHVNAMEFMLDGFVKGKTDRECLLELGTGKPIDFTGK
jgi:enoyl-CoA hydratase